MNKFLLLFNKLVELFSPRSLAGNLFLFMLVGLISIVIGCKESEIPENPEHRIVIQGYISPNFQTTSPRGVNFHNAMRIQYVHLNDIEGIRNAEVIEEKVKNGKVRFITYSSEELLLTLPFSRTFIVHPGDSVHINYDNEKIIFSGNEKHAGRFAFISELIDLDKQMTNPTKKTFFIKSLGEFLQWNSFIDNKLVRQMSLIEKYKNNLTDLEYNYYKQQMISMIESNRVEAFSVIIALARKDSMTSLTYSDLNAIWDSTQYKTWARWVRSLPEYYGSISDIHTFNRLEVQRKFNFNFSNDSLKNKEMRTYLYYTNARDQYKGLTRERLMAFVLDEQTIIEMGLKNPMTQMILNDYYSQPGYPEYKQWVRKLEEEQKVKEAESERKKT